MSVPQLHVHSQYSFLDGIESVADIVKAVANQGASSLAITEHGNLCSLPELMKEAKEQDINPIPGCEFYFAEDLENRDRKADYSHLTVLAMSDLGLKNLVQLSTRSFIEGFYYRPRINFEMLQEHSEDLIIMTACLGGVFAKTIDSDRLGKMSVFKEIFGDRFYLEVMDSGVEGQDDVNEVAMMVGVKLGIPCVLTGDLHYLDVEDADVQAAACAVRLHKKYEEKDKDPYVNTYLRDLDKLDCPEEWTQIASEIAQRCKIEKFEFNPGILIPNADDVLRENTMTGWEYARKNKVEPGLYTKYEEQLKYELDVISSLGASQTCLVAGEAVALAKDLNVMVGPSRGSAGGSLVLWCLGVTEMDPIKHELLFERFLQKDRVVQPDIDIDFDSEGRDKVISAMRDKYGNKNVLEVSAFSTFSERSLMDDLGRIFSLSHSAVAECKDIVIERGAVNMAEDKEFSDKAGSKADLIAKCLVKLSGNVRHRSKHAAGVIVGAGEFNDLLPMSTGPAVQWAGDIIEDLGFLKLDILSLKTLSLLKEAQEYCDLDVIDLPLDDRKAYKVLCDGFTVGIFQLESAGATNLTKAIKPRNFKTLTDVLALYRPGPLGSKMDKDYIERCHKKAKVTYIHAKLEPVLRDTYGLFIYQEQVMEAAMKLADFTPAEADMLRKAMGKKVPEIMAKEKARFEKQATKNVGKKIAKIISDQIEYFAGWAFNKSHGVAYAFLTYWSAYLKAHHPAAFLCACLNTYHDNEDKLARLVDECRRLEVALLPPDVNGSSKNFILDEQGIRIGLLSLKGVGEATVNRVIEERWKHGLYRTMEDLRDRTRIAKDKISVFQDCGALDSVGEEPYRFKILTDGERVSKEMKILGRLATVTPLDPHKKTLKRLKALTIEDVLGMKLHSNVLFGAYFTDIHKIKTKGGDSMAFLNLADGTGQIDAVIFPSIWSEVGGRCTGDNDGCLAIKGTVDSRNGQRQIKVRGLQLLEKLRK